jgi:hypothetical protein
MKFLALVIPTLIFALPRHGWSGMSQTERGAIVGASVGVGLGGLALITGTPGAAASLAVGGTVTGATVGGMVDISDMAKKIRDSQNSNSNN